MSGQYPKYSQEANDLLDFARSVRRFASRYPDQICAGDIFQHVDRFASNYPWDLLDIVLDHEEREARFVAVWRKWRNARRHSLYARRSSKDDGSKSKE